MLFLKNITILYREWRANLCQTFKCVKLIFSSILSINFHITVQDLSKNSINSAKVLCFYVLPWSFKNFENYMISEVFIEIIDNYLIPKAKKALWKNWNLHQEHDPKFKSDL